MDNIFTDLGLLIDWLNFMATSKKRYVYRGYNLERELYPKIIRDTDFSTKEYELLMRFEQHARSYGNITNETDFMLCAQHYGLPTRLLDFTFNPFTALFFALFEPKDAVEKYAITGDEKTYYSLRYADINNVTLTTQLGYAPSIAQLSGEAPITFSLLAMQSVKKYEEFAEAQGINKFVMLHPHYTDIRISMQQGLFMVPYTLDKTKHIQLIENNTVQIKIHKELRGSLLSYLNMLGFNTYRLMPDLASVCFAVKNDIEREMCGRTV